MSILARLQTPNLMRTQALINGQWLQSGRTFAVINPATGVRFAQVVDSTPDMAEQAIAAAQASGPAWRGLHAKKRSQILRKWFDLMLLHQHDLACIMTAEQGKPLQEAMAEVAYGASFVEWFAEEAKRAYGEVLPPFDAHRRASVLLQPVGVCAAITPWNFPFAMVTRKVAPALAAGCTVVLKPSELTPLTALALAQLALEAGVPAGVLNMLPASAEQSVAIGQVLCASPIVRHLSFTGSTEVGRLLMAQSAPTVKRLSLELGGNAPFIVFDDANLDQAVQGAVASKFRNAGQTCICANRIYVQSTIYDAFIEQFKQQVQPLMLSNGFDPQAHVGPLINQAAIDKVEQHLQNAVELGGHIVCGGHARPDLGSALFFEPTIVSHATHDMLCAKEETFGPLAPVFAFDTEDEVIALANDTESGLACYIYTQDVSRAHRVSEGLEYGMVGINTPVLGTEHAPFGGIKQSGLGREGSRHGMLEYLNMKLICTGNIQSA